MNSSKQLLIASALTLSFGAQAVDLPLAVGNSYEITITNLTKAQSFTPILVASHRNNVRLFNVGQPASDALAEMAEGGATAPLEDYLLQMSDRVGDVSTSPGLLGPGESATVPFERSFQYPRLSIAAMLIPTNDTFFAISGVKIPNHHGVFEAHAYDAGSELNDELCASIPGPVCGGEGGSVEDGEGFVHIANGISGEGDLAASTYDWRGPVARVRIKRVYQ
ncbi:MAG: hypothetical protein DHS20C11_11260 [Lysobacteraceae bacterium]|nr:MAG: hypothetical protein DHS20C11_11260 [Xanthomonadaceae bacterium]